MKRPHEPPLIHAVKVIAPDRTTPNAESRNKPRNIMPCCRVCCRKSKELIRLGLCAVCYHQERAILILPRLKRPGPVSIKRRNRAEADALCPGIGEKRPSSSKLMLPPHFRAGLRQMENNGGKFFTLRPSNADRDGGDTPPASQRRKPRITFLPIVTRNETLNMALMKQPRFPRQLSQRQACRPWNQTDKRGTDAM